jgi:hypothetical protein
MSGSKVKKMEDMKPVAKFRAGQVTCAVWENQVTVGNQQQTILKASVSRRYRDKSGVWKSSQSFSRNEIPLAVYVLQKAFEAMLEKPAEQDDVVHVEDMVV